MSDNNTFLDMTGRVAIVTGAGQGVGRGIASLLAQQNAAVCVNDFFAERAEAVAAEIRAAGGRAIGVAGDVSDLGSVAEMVKTTEADLGPVDILVNNAGNAGPSGFPMQMPKFWETDPDQWQRYFSVNLYGVLNCCHATVGGMVERGYGRVVTIISDAARGGEPRMAAYSAAKAGAAGFMRALAKEVGKAGVTANCISLGSINSPQLAEQYGAAFTPEMMQKQLRGYTVPRLGEPEDIAAMVTFLASSEAAWITGQTYPVNGGFSVAL